MYITPLTIFMINFGYMCHVAQADLEHVMYQVMILNFNSQFWLQAYTTQTFYKQPMYFTLNLINNETNQPT